MGFRAMLIRGLLGGALGGFLVVLPVITSGWSNWLSTMLLAFVIVGLPYGVFVGGLVAASIWIISNKARKNLGPLTSAVVGMIVGILFWVVYTLITSDRRAYESSLANICTFVGLYAAATGLLPGLFVGWTSRSKREFKGQS